MLTLPLMAKADVFKIGMPESFKPYTYKLDGPITGEPWTGIDLDIGRELHKRMGLEVTYESMPWARQLAYAEKGLSAGILTVYCEDKQGFLELTQESFYQIKIALFARKDTWENKLLDSLESLPDNSVIGIVRGNHYAADLERYPNLKISYAHSTSLLVDQLYLKRIDYVMDEYLPFMFYSKEKSYTDSFVEVMTYLEDEVCTAFSKTYFGDKASVLADKASEHIKALKAEGFIDRVIQKYKD